MLALAAATTVITTVYFGLHVPRGVSPRRSYHCDYSNTPAIRYLSDGVSPLNLPQFGGSRAKLSPTVVHSTCQNNQNNKTYVQKSVEQIQKKYNICTLFFCFLSLTDNYTNDTYNDSYTNNNYTSMVSAPQGCAIVHKPICDA